MFRKAAPYLEKLIPLYAIVPLVSCFVFNCVVYFGTELFTASRKHYDFTTSFDRAVPLIPSFVLIYLGCYLFWVVNYILISRQGKEHCLRFVTAELLSRLVCGLFFLLLPTTNVRPLLEQEGLFNRLLGLVYLIDPPTRLFPSIHCLVSWFCYIGIRGKKQVHPAYRIFSCLFALLVCVSTQVTKQHYIVDAIGAIALAEAAWFLSFHFPWYRKLEPFFDRCSFLLFGDACKPNEE